METIYAIIKDNKVVNCIVAKNWHDGVNITDLSPRPGIGWDYIDGEFIAPEPGDHSSETIGPEMTRLSFLRRFTLTERIAMAGSQDPIIQDGLLMLQVAEDIRLDDPDTIALVGYMHQQGFITEERAEEILTS